MFVYSTQFWFTIELMMLTFLLNTWNCSVAGIFHCAVKEPYEVIQAEINKAHFNSYTIGSVVTMKNTLEM